MVDNSNHEYDTRSIVKVFLISDEGITAKPGASKYQMANITNVDT